CRPPCEQAPRRHPTETIAAQSERLEIPDSGPTPAPATWQDHPHSAELSSHGNRRCTRGSPTARRSAASAVSFSLCTTTFRIRKNSDEDRTGPLCETRTRYATAQQQRAR